MAGEKKGRAPHWRRKKEVGGAPGGESGGALHGKSFCAKIPTRPPARPDHCPIFFSDAPPLPPPPLPAGGGRRRPGGGLPHPHPPLRDHGDCCPGAGGGGVGGCGAGAGGRGKAAAARRGGRVVALRPSRPPQTFSLPSPLSHTQADPAAAYAAWAAHWRRPTSPADFTAWKENVLPRAARAAAGSSAPRLVLNGLASLPLAALAAGRAAPHPARLAAAEDEAFASATWAAFPYAADVAAAATVDAGAAPGLLGGPACLGKKKKPVPPPLPPAVDWHAAGLVGPVKNQHVNNTPCGCCWSFASTGVMEAALAVAAAAEAEEEQGGRGGPARPPPPPPSLSEQELIDCDRGPPFKDAGCDGGDFEGGVRFAIQEGGLTTEAAYPYRGKDGRCHRRRARTGRVGGVTGFVHVPTRSEAALRAALAHAPVAVAVCCSDAFIGDWHAYTGGVLTFTNGTGVTSHPTLAQLAGCAKPLDHAVVVVGYGVEPGAGPDGGDLPVWLVKNSWGDAWGEGGYFKLAAGLPKGADNRGKGAAGLLTMPGFPTVGKAEEEMVGGGQAAMGVAR